MKGITAKVKIGFADSDAAKASTAAKYVNGVVFESNAEAAKEADFIFLALKPQALSSVLTEISAVIRERITSGKTPILVSMAAGWSISRIQALVSGMGTEAPAAKTPQGSIPIARIMPNTPALVSRGMIAISVSPKFPAAKLTELEEMLSGTGLTDQVEELYMDAITGLSGSGPAYVFEFIEALADGGVLAGLPRDKALRYAAQTVFGSAAMTLESGKHPGALKDMVASPGGTTIQGLAALERGAFRGTVISAVEAAWKRSQELGKSPL
jgi:pyrroline-5-carboxylate reductase